MLLKQLFLCVLLSSCVFGAEPGQDPLSPELVVTAGRLDQIVVDTDPLLTTMREVDLGRTQAADRLRGYYDEQSLRKMSGLYEGARSSSVDFYIDENAGSVVMVSSTSVSPNLPAERYYVIGDRVIARNPDTLLREASSGEAADVREFYRQFRTTLDRAASGIYDDPSAFERE